MLSCHRLYSHFPSNANLDLELEKKILDVKNTMELNEGGNNLYFVLIYMTAPNGRITHVPIRFTGFSVSLPVMN